MSCTESSIYRESFGHSVLCTLWEKQFSKVQFELQIGLARFRHIYCHVVTNEMGPGLVSILVCRA